MKKKHLNHWKGEWSHPIWQIVSLIWQYISPNWQHLSLSARWRTGTGFDSR